MEKNLAEYGDILRPEDVQKILHVRIRRYITSGGCTENPSCGAQYCVQVPGGRYDQINSNW